MRYLAECLTHTHPKMAAVLIFIANRLKIRFFSIKSHVILNFIYIYIYIFFLIQQNAAIYTMRLLLVRVEIHGIDIGNLESELERRFTIRMLETYLNYNYTFQSPPKVPVWESEWRKTAYARSLMINDFTLRGFHYSTGSAFYYGKKENVKTFPGFEEKMCFIICLDQSFYWISEYWPALCYCICISFQGLGNVLRA